MGILIAIFIISAWLVHLAFSLIYLEVNFLDPFFYLNIFIQTYLFTGLFITAHDSMHGTLSKNKKLNKLIGQLSTFLFACMSYNKLIKNHMNHHRYPGTENDPDFSSFTQNFFIWWGKFLWRYTTILQIILMGIIFNILKIWFEEINIFMFWVLPALLSTFQLFFFGTYLPHRKPHIENMVPHNARSQKKNHLWAMLSCYFFGYHFEHHENPGIPWWQLYRTK
jgi:beta-carotene/zeaxanthin 4-ketolase